MDISNYKDIKFELVSEDGVSTFVINKKRVLVGSGQSCDLVLTSSGIEGVHCVIEQSGDGLRFYDMNTSAGTYLNGQNAIVKDAKVGDKVCFGEMCFSIDSFDATIFDERANVPPVLNSKELNDDVPLTPRRINKGGKAAGRKGSFDEVEYPLANLPIADSLEYIFELPEFVENVLHYDLYKKSIEVTVCIGSSIFSIDYLSSELSSFHLFGGFAGNGVSLPYLAKGEQVVFCEKKQNKLFLNKIDGFEFLMLDDGAGGKEILKDESLAVYMSDHMKIFIRLSESPPITIVEPFLKNDKVFWKFFAIVLSLIFIFLLFVGFMDVNEELKEKRAPQKLASILYKKPVLSVSIDRTKKKNKKIVQKAKSKRKVIKPSKRKNKNFTKKNKAKSISKKVAKKTAGANKTKKKITKFKKKTSGNIDTYKAVDFSASLPSNLSKSSDISKISNEQNNNFEYKADSPTAKNLGDDIKLNNFENKVEDISKNASKDLSDTGTLSDFQNDKVMATAGIPSRTVVLGGMDPDTIRRILMDHLPQFRYCYQKELDKSKQEFSGRITLNFVIGASGYVTRAGVKESSMPQIVKGCVVNVLKGIPFPSPRGGGVVEVTQPMNFYPKT